MTEPIKPALTAEQWQTYLPVLQGDTATRDLNIEAAIHAFGLQSAAALALYGQPFGFTREMVNALRIVVRGWDGCDDESETRENEYVGEEIYPLLEAAIENLEALLPPEKT